MSSVEDMQRGGIMEGGEGCWLSAANENENERDGGDSAFIILSCQMLRVWSSNNKRIIFIDVVCYWRVTDAVFVGRYSLPTRTLLDSKKRRWYSCRFFFQLSCSSCDIWCKRIFNNKHSCRHTFSWIRQKDSSPTSSSLLPPWEIASLSTQQSCPFHLSMKFWRFEDFFSKNKSDKSVTIRVVVDLDVP